MTDGNFFRASVGAMIINSRGEILVFERTKVKNAWQMPQGGLENDESPSAGVRREVFEETGVSPDRLELLGEMSEWLAYELPEAYRSGKTGRGQVQKWFLFRFLGLESDIRPDHKEFRKARWVDGDTLMQLAADFRRPVYRRVLQEFRRHFPVAAT